MDMVYEACKILKLVLQARAPYDTGNLAMNNIRIDRNRGRVIVGSAESAPYAPITNEPWTSEKWHGKKNPNEGWIQRAIEESLPIIQRVLSGKATDKDVQAAFQKYYDIRAERKKLYVEELKKKRDNIVREK